MKKIKADSVLKRLGFKYTWVNDGCMIIISTHPEGSEEGLRVYLGSDTSIIDYDNSVYELDFEEPKQEIQKSLFEKGDTVYILSHSNNGDFGMSCKGEVLEFLSNVGCSRVKLENGFHEIHKDVNISFTPFSIHEGGFSQIRPEPQPKTGDWGWFWDNDDDVSIDGYRFGYFKSIVESKTRGIQYKCLSGSEYDNFSLKNPTQKND